MRMSGQPLPFDTDANEHAEEADSLGELGSMGPPAPAKFPYVRPKSHDIC